jgi:hypothetical protein
MGTQDLRKMNMYAELLMPSGGRRWLEKVVANWRQFSSGLWRVPEDDISAAYSAKTSHKIKCSRTKADYSQTTAGISPGWSLRKQPPLPAGLLATGLSIPARLFENSPHMSGSIAPPRLEHCNEIITIEQGDTLCIEAGAVIPTVSRGLGHRDGRLLPMKVYGRLPPSTRARWLKK